jgi:hypothetical protein
MIQWQDVLTRLSENRELHARFLNSISLMEYMGARKIMKSQHEKDVSFEVLAHMSEEVRHAQIFKKMALKLSEGQLISYDEPFLLAGNEARAYIQTVDQSVCQVLQQKDTHLNYLLSTLLIEERANSVYPFYIKLVEPYGFGSHIQKILREEEHHLKEIEDGLKQKQILDDQQMAHLRAQEQLAFDQLIAAVDRELKKCASSSQEIS